MLSKLMRQAAAGAKYVLCCKLQFYCKLSKKHKSKLEGDEEEEEGEELEPLKLSSLRPNKMLIIIIIQFVISLLVSSSSLLNSGD